MKKKYSWFKISNQKRSDWEKVCPPSEYRVMSGSHFQATFNGLLPVELTEKYTSIFIAGSPTKNGIVYMANGNRVDYKPMEIDQMPFGLAFISDSVSGSGILLQHGKWDGRTTSAPDEFWNQISASQLDGVCYPLSELPQSSSGKLDELQIDSQRAALGKLVDILRNKNQL